MKPEVLAKYRLKGVEAGKLHFAGFGTIDLREIDLTEADNLYKAKFPYLELQPKVAAEIKKNESASKNQSEEIAKP